MSTNGHTIETTVTLRLSDRASKILAEQAANSGQDIAAVASDLIEHVVSRPSIAQIMAPVRKEVAESGIGDEALDSLLRHELEDHRREKKAKQA